MTIAESKSDAERVAGIAARRIGDEIVLYVATGIGVSYEIRLDLATAHDLVEQADAMRAKGTWLFEITQQARDWNATGEVVDCRAGDSEGDGGGE